MKVWMRGRAESLIAPQAASMSALWVRARPQITGPCTWRAIASTASKSPGEVIGKPASITSTPSRPSWVAISTFSWVLSEMPGDCSPSRRVVSKISTRLASSTAGRSWLSPAYCSQRSSLISFSLLSGVQIVSRGYRAAQRYSPRGGRRRRRARLWAGRITGRESSADAEIPHAGVRPGGARTAHADDRDPAPHRLSHGAHRARRAGGRLAARGRRLRRAPDPALARGGDLPGPRPGPGGGARPARPGSRPSPAALAGDRGRLRRRFRRTRLPRARGDPADGQRGRGGRLARPPATCTTSSSGRTTTSPSASSTPSTT